MSSTTKCPECGELISKRFPLHNCDSAISKIKIKLVKKKIFGGFLYRVYYKITRGGTLKGMEGCNTYKTRKAAQYFIRLLKEVKSTREFFNIQ